jgi:hypothetical protein
VSACALLCGPAWSDAAEPPSAPWVIGPGHEQEVLRLLEPLKLGGPIADGCLLRNVSIDGSTIDLTIGCPSGMSHLRLQLRRPLADGPGAPSLEIEADAGVPPDISAFIRRSLRGEVRPSLLVRASPPPPSRVPDFPYERWPLWPLFLILGSASAVAWRRSRLSAGPQGGSDASTGDLLAAGFAIVAFAAGAALRLSYPGDIEYKWDESSMFKDARAIARGAPWPALGWPSSLSVVNPGPSIWIFVLLLRISGASTPVGLARAVVGLNLLALAVLFGFALRLRGNERRQWMWAGALAAVSPLAVIMQRKIWSPSVLPIFSLLTLLAWRRRNDAKGAFFWGLMGALVGQIHMTGFFLSAALIAGALILRRLRAGPPTVWPAWLAGTTVGSISLVPWLIWWLQHRPSVGDGLHAGRLTGWRLWLENSVGCGLDHSLGPEHLQSFLSAPCVRLAYGAVALGCAGALWLAIRTRRADWAALARTHGFQAFAIVFVLYGYGAATLPVGFPPHYLFVVFPLDTFTFPLLATAGNRRPWPLAVLFLAHAVIAASLLSYLHVHHGAPGGDYGVGWQYQPVAPD